MPYTGKLPRHNGKIKNQNNVIPQPSYNAGLHFLSSQNVSNSGQLQINRKYVNNMGNINEVSVVQYRRTTNMQLKNNSLDMNHFQNLRHHQQAFVYKTPHYHNHMNPNIMQKFPVNHPMQRRICKDQARASPLHLAHTNVEIIGNRSREFPNQQNANNNKYVHTRLKSLPTNVVVENHEISNLQNEQQEVNCNTNFVEQKQVPEKVEKTIVHVDDDKGDKKTEIQQIVGEILNTNSEQPIADQNQDTNTKSSKIAREKTPMCLINDLARFNKISFQYRLTSENGPAHCKRFTVTLMLGDEEYTAEGLKIKEAQHLAAKEAIEKTKYKHPTPKVIRRPDDDASKPNITPTVELNALAMKLGQQTYYIMDHQQVENNSIYKSVNQQFDTNQELMKHQPTDAIENILHNGRKIQTITQQRRHNLSRYQNRFSNFQHISKNGCVPTAYSFYSPDCPSKITLIVGSKQFVGVGRTLQLAKHDAASNALKVLKEQMEKEQLEIQNETTEENDNKSPISLVFEIGIKRNLPVDFKVLREEGPAHMRTFVTACIVGDIVTEGEGTGKKVSKKKAAHKMLEELKKLPPLSPVASPAKRTKVKNSSKRNCEQTKDVTTAEHKENVEKRSSHRSKKIADETEQTNSIGKLIEWHQNKKEKEPEFKLINEIGKENSRRKQFVMEVSSNNIVVRGVGISKRLAKQDAAQKFLNAVMNDTRDQPESPALDENTTRNSYSAKNSKAETFSKTANSKPLAEQDAIKNAVKETNPAQLSLIAKEKKPVSVINNSQNHSEENCSKLPKTDACQVQEKNEPTTNPSSCNSLAPATTKESTTTTNSTKSVNLHMKDQLMYLAKLLGFDVEFSDYPKGNHNEFLTIVMLSTTPPQICHGVGVNAIESQEDAAKNALKILSEMGLNNAIKS